MKNCKLYFQRKFIKYEIFINEAILEKVAIIETLYRLRNILTLRTKFKYDSLFEYFIIIISGKWKTQILCLQPMQKVEWVINI